MNELIDLYQDIILDHSQNPQNFGELKQSTGKSRGHNPICGDDILISINQKKDELQDIRFCGSGCAISQASASLMTQRVKGMPVTEIKNIFDNFLAMLKNQDYNQEFLGKLLSLEGVRNYPMRVKCATLCWHTLMAALDNNGEQNVTPKDDV